ncbi:glutamate-1-semialdehyde 2,1-aminomutase [Delitschia confertaspora ATCC 74209]|uniref:Glutamate-1-semialdehyde 2,1-aminomutase n=1 Tax=Delitschia confertaspora ATCC 74209 TaxID=1513339 RepID=A0A9P4MWJ6_9PLEO|nr:glutamate-1-semialdehyde 2,1-aminomutase [Delitschia confertaspora ATCC 74209]
MSSSYSTTAEALEAARQRFTERNLASLKLHNEATESLPGGNTRSVLYSAPFPVFMNSGKGYQVFSEDGHIYTDLVAELTAGLYGHSQPHILSTLQSTLTETGLNLGATTKLEMQHARLLCERFGLGRVRFTNSGTEATLHAIMGARKYTGRRKIVVFGGGYHGACFFFCEGGSAENNVDREDWIIARYNDIEDAKSKIESHATEIAAVLVEGMQGSGPCIVGDHEFLLAVQESARKIGAVFIFDEVMTSRLAPGGLQEIVGLKPDITTLGKWLGGGITFGAFGGREDMMQVYDPRVQGGLAHSGTFNNNTLGMAAGHAGLSQVYTADVAVEFNKTGDKFRKKLQEVSKGTKMTVTGLGTILGIHWLVDGRKELRTLEDRREDKGLLELFWLEMLEDGFWITQRGSLALILGTPEGELDRFVEVVKKFLEKYKTLVEVR